MSLFQCENCGCCESTALSAQGFAPMKDLFDWTGIEDRKGMLLCSVCGPTRYRDGVITKYGEWHRVFPRVFLPKGMFITNRVGNLAHKETGDENFRKYEIKPTCTDERPCVNCFSGQGECEVGPFGGPELLEQARALCQAIERLPAGEHQTNLISKVAVATFALQNLQSTGDYFWPRPVAPSLLDTSRISAEDLEALKAKLMSLRDNGGIMTPVLAAPMLTQAAQSVLAERRRQVEVEGRTPESDDQYAGGQLAFAAIAYLMVGVNPNGAAQWWPWDAKTFKPSPDTRRNLVKAGALLLADIEWVDRRQAAATPVPDDLTQFLEQTDFDAAEKVASEKADDNQTNDSDKR